MKKIIAILWVILAIPAFTAFQYSEGEGGWLTDINNVSIIHYAPASKYGQVKSFGWFTFKDGEITGSGKLAVKPNREVVLPDFSDGNLGFWISTKKSGETLYSMSSFNDDNTNWFHKFNANVYTFGDEKWDTGGLLALKIVDNTPMPPMGQPLPGALATLLVAGGVIGCVSWKKKPANQ